MSICRKEFQRNNNTTVLILKIVLFGHYFAV